MQKLESGAHFTRKVSELELLVSQRKVLSLFLRLELVVALFHNGQAVQSI